MNLHIFGPLPHHYHQPRPSFLSHTTHSIMYTQASRNSSRPELIMGAFQTCTHTHSVTKLISQSAFKNDLTSQESCLRFHTEQTHTTPIHTYPDSLFLIYSLTCIMCANKRACSGGNTEEIEWPCFREDIKKTRRTVQMGPEGVRTKFGK